MTTAEQMVYTTANIRGRRGYQVVAKSRGIVDECESELRPHFLPLGISPDQLVESHSLAELSGRKVAYCHARNIGAGHDGRRDTLCSHIFVISRADFAKIGCDTRALSPLHPRRRRMRGILPPVELESLRAPPAPSPEEASGLEPVFAAALRPLLEGKRVAVPSDDPAMAQKFLALLPPSARLVQFASVAAANAPSAGRLANCRLVFYPRGKRPGSKSGFRIAAAGHDTAVNGDGALGRAAHHYAKIALGGDQQRLSRIQGHFEAVPTLSDRDRMVLACAYEQFLECDDGTARAQHARDAFSAVKNLETSAFSSYFDAIKNYVESYREAADAFRTEPERSSDLLGAWLSSFPLAIGIRMFGAFLDSYSHGRRFYATADCRDAGAMPPSKPIDASADRGTPGRSGVHGAGAGPRRGSDKS